MSDYVYYRKNAGDPDNAVLPPRSEREIRALIGASGRSVERALQTLKRGKPVRTPYATYTAEPVPQKTR